MRRPRKRRRRIKVPSALERLNSRMALAFVLMVFLALDGFLFYRYQRALQSTGDETANAPLEEASLSLEEEPTTAEETTSSSMKEQGGGAQVLVSVVNVPVGLSILEDGQVVRDQVTNPGFSEEFEAEEAVTVGAADGGAVQVGIDGENSEPLGLSGEPATRTFTPESES